MVPSRGVRFDSQAVVYGAPQLLLASKVALRRLDRDMTQKKLDLVQFSTSEVAETGTGMSAAVVHASTAAFTHVGSGRFVRVLPYPPNRQSPSAPPVAGSTRGSEPTALRGGARSRSTWRPSRGHATHGPSTASHARVVADPARASASFRVERRSVALLSRAGCPPRVRDSRDRHRPPRTPRAERRRAEG